MTNTSTQSVESYIVSMNDATQTLWYFLETNNESKQEAITRVQLAKDADKAGAELEEMFDNGYALSVKPLRGTLYGDLMSLGYLSIEWDLLAQVLAKKTKSQS